MKYIGIKLADGSFYPVLEEGKSMEKQLDLTTVQDNQTTVQIDLYRSATNSMEDAEYVDTLEIKNMKPHPNGEPDLQLSVSINDTNELTAEVIDPETGKKSETQVTLVSRTLAERNATPVNFSIDDQEKEPEVIEEPIVPTENVAEEESIAIPDIDIPVNELDIDNEDTTLSDEELASIQKNTSELNSDEKPADTVNEDTDVIGPSPNNEDFSFDDLTVDSATTETAATKEKEAVLEPTVFDTSDFEKAVTEETLDTTPDNGEEKTITSEEVSAEESVPEEPIVEEPLVEEQDVEEKDAIGDIDLNLPDFNDITPSETTTDVTDSLPDEIEEKSSTEETKQIFNESEYSVPDFDQQSPTPTGLTDYFEDPAFKDPVFTNTDTSIDETAEKKSDDDLNLDLPETSESSDLSDTSAEYDTIQEKTKTPVIICIVCAVICIIATLLVLFIIPSKINLIKSRNTRNTQPSVAEKPAEPAPAKEPEPVATEPAPAEEPVPAEETVAPAVEDEVVVAPTPEVVPEKPAAPKEKPAAISYKIKWGDTLWDIADAYYKNPWRYHKLASYNHIKNPDLIISGTHILIPAE